jgi:hypothetical protein
VKEIKYLGYLDTERILVLKYILRNYIFMAMWSLFTWNTTWAGSKLFKYVALTARVIWRKS